MQISAVVGPEPKHFCPPFGQLRHADKSPPDGVDRTYFHYVSLHNSGSRLGLNGTALDHRYAGGRG